jgi:hypothetical protein
MTPAGGHIAGPSRWSMLSRAELAHASRLLACLDELAGRQRVAIARMAGAELASLDGEQTALEAELRALLEQAGLAGGEPASAADRAAVAALSARVRRTCQHNLGLLMHARRSVYLLLGFDEERAGYDRRARRVTGSNKAPMGAL